jgi:hypothetical protein
MGARTFMLETRSVKTVAQFLGRVEKLSDVDYGDFKRKVGFYLTELEKSLGGPSLSESQKEIIYRLRLLVVFNNPDTDIELVRQRTLEMAKRLS